MTILPHFATDTYLNKLKNDFAKTLYRVSEPHNQIFSIRNYTDIVENLGLVFQEYCRNEILDSIKSIDTAFRESDLRKRDYYVKENRERTIVTVFGVIRFKRTIYQNKYTKKCFTYLDRKLGFSKWDTYDPCVKSMISELYADNNSMIKVGAIIGDRIYSPYSSKVERSQFRISRQTVQNVLKSNLLVKQKFKTKQSTPTDLYIMADEKYVPIQNYDNKKVMVKAAVIFESIEKADGHKDRKKIIEKIVYSSIDDNFWEDIYDIVSERYDINKIKKIHIMGDGANWIKKGTQEFPIAEFSLDKFHFLQALHHISIDESIKSILKSYIINNKKHEFKTLMNILIEENPLESRKNTMLEKQDYIINNWKYIQNTYHNIKYGCSMESAISHMLAAVFTSRPKAYSKENLRHYLTLRNLHLNHVNIRAHYLDSLHKERTKKHFKEKEVLDFSMFEPNTVYEKSSTSNFIKGFINRINY